MPTRQSLTALEELMMPKIVQANQRLLLGIWSFYLFGYLAASANVDIQVFFP